MSESPLPAPETVSEGASMLTLHYGPGKASLAPHMMLAEIGCAFELALVDTKAGQQKTAEFLRLNPVGRIPVLVDGDLVLHEAAAICLHLADRFPDAGLAPPPGTPERGALYKWLVYLTNTIQPEYRAYYYSHEHTDDPAGADAVRSAAERRAVEFFDPVERALADDRPWLLGDRISAADFYLLMMTRWGRNMAKPPRDLPHVGAHAARVLERPAVQAVLAREGLTAPYV